MKKKKVLIAGLAVGTAIVVLAKFGHHMVKQSTPKCDIKPDKKVEEMVPEAVIDSVIYNPDGSINFKMSFPDEDTIPPAVIDSVIHNPDGSINFKMSFPDELENGQAETKIR